MIRAVIIDDEACFRDMIQLFLVDYFPEIEVVAHADGVEGAVTLLEDCNPDLVFLDIEINGGTGFHVLQKSKNRNFKLIFITAFNDFAIQAIKFSAIDYILKPINEFEFKAGVERAIQEIEKHEAQSPIDNLFNNYSGSQNKRLVLKTLTEIHLVDTDQVVRCEADNAYTTFVLLDGEKVVVSKGLGEYVDLLKDFGFVRTHQSHLVNLKYLKKISKSDGGFLILKDNSKVPISVRQKQQLFETLNKL
jgi:two-component system LytT family response regulator